MVVEHKEVTIRQGRKLHNWRVPTIPPLMHWQKERAAEAFDKKRLLAFPEPGAGKTLYALEALTYIHNYIAGEGWYGAGDIGRALIVCPKIALKMWATWTAGMMENEELPAHVQILTGPADVIWPETTHVIVTYGMLARKSSTLDARLDEWAPDAVVLDESDQLSGKDSNRTIALIGKGGVATNATWVLPMTGTPIPRYADGLFPILRALFPKQMIEEGWDTYTKFVNYFCRTKSVKVGNMKVDRNQVCGNQQGKMEYLFNFLYDKGLAFVEKVELPHGYHDRDILLDFKESKELRDLTNDLLAESEGGEHSPLLTSVSALLGEEKAEYVAEYVNMQLLEKRRHGDMSGIFVPYWHTVAGGIIASKLGDYGWQVAVISGHTTPSADQAAEENFNSGKLDVIVGQIQATGVAINLQENCNHVVFAERDWSASRQEQSLKRVFRKGQERAVQVDYCIGTNPVEDMKISVTSRKEAGANAAIRGEN